MARAAAGGPAVSNRVSRRQGERWAPEQPREHAQPYAAPPPPEAAPAPSSAGSATDRVAALRQLGELREQGVLTDAEFAAKKQQLLDRM